VFPAFPRFHPLGEKSLSSSVPHFFVSFRVFRGSKCFFQVEDLLVIGDPVIGFTRRKRMSAERHPVFTIGHSNLEMGRFVALLKQHGIQAIADVRSSYYGLTPGSTG
jgi:hypothetical protein